ncbi:MAG: flagellar basal body L-ring protein FlgH [bacterium]|nr:flagellar basal body L-ring protein FlgH [bacterium]
MIIMVFILLAFIPEGRGESLWSGEGSLFEDHKARHIGDVVTIVILEQTNAFHSTSTKRAKDIEGGAKGEKGNLLSLLPFIGGKSSYKGDGQTKRSGGLTAKVTAEIIRILPNGNLGIEGRRVIRVNSEEEEIVITGEVRPEDISSDNTVLSTYISNAKIRYRGCLKFSDKEKPGVISRLLAGICNFLF